MLHQVEQRAWGNDKGKYILVKNFPLRAVGEQLYLCEDCIWKPVTVNQLWRQLRTSDLTYYLDVDSFTEHESIGVQGVQTR